MSVKTFSTPHFTAFNAEPVEMFNAALAVLDGLVTDYCKSRRLIHAGDLVMIELPQGIMMLTRTVTYDE
jgi:hypothetical protein